MSSFWQEWFTLLDCVWWFKCVENKVGNISNGSAAKNTFANKVFVRGSVFINTQF